MQAHRRHARHGQDGARQYGKNLDGIERNTAAELLVAIDFNKIPRDDAKTCCEVTPWA